MPLAAGAAGRFRLVSDRRPRRSDRAPTTRSERAPTRGCANVRWFVRWRRAIRGARPLRAVAPVAAGSGSSAGGERPLGGPKQRLVLALLLAEPNTTVSVERLIDGVWGESPPESARHTLQSYVSELRKAIGDVIERDGTGYAITRRPRRPRRARVRGSRRARRAAQLGAEPDGGGRRARRRARPVARAAVRGPPGPAGAAGGGDAARGAPAGRDRGTCSGAGSPSASTRPWLSDLERLTREHPYREELRALHMLALYRSGRQADALRAFQATRDRARRGARHRPVAAAAAPRGADPAAGPRPRSRAAQRSRPRVGASGAVENPYMGLRAFREADPARFFGQDRLVEQLVEPGDRAPHRSRRSSARAARASRAPCRPG